MNWRGDDGDPIKDGTESGHLARQPSEAIYIAFDLEAGHLAIDNRDVDPCCRARQSEFVYYRGARKFLFVDCPQPSVQMRADIAIPQKFCSLHGDPLTAADAVCL